MSGGLTVSVNDCVKFVDNRLTMNRIRKRLPPFPPLSELEDSTSSGDIPKSKLDRSSPLSPSQVTKKLDLESAVLGPGRKRNVSPPVEELQFVDLKVSITDREKRGTKTDSYVAYKICTEVGGRVMTRT